LYAARRGGTSAAAGASVGLGASGAGGGRTREQIGADDAPGVVLPNGHVIFAGDTPYGQTPSQMFEFDPTANGGAGSITQLTLPGPLTQALNDNAAFIDRMLMLPNGHVLFGDGTTQLWDYNPAVTPVSGSQPTVSSVVSNGNLTFALTGTQLNGISEGAGYGDDAQMSSDYPIVELTSGGGTVTFAKTFNWLSQVATDGTSVTTQFTVPAGLAAGPYSLTVSANGIASAPFSFSVPLAVSGSNPAAGSTVAAPPASYVVHFNEAVAPGSVAAADLQVNGVSATGVSLDPTNTTATFTYSASPVTAAGPQNMSVAAGLITGQAGSTNTAFSASFVYAPGTLTLTPTARSWPTPSSTRPRPTRRRLRPRSSPGRQGAPASSRRPPGRSGPRRRRRRPPRWRGTGAPRRRRSCGPTSSPAPRRSRPGRRTPPSSASWCRRPRWPRSARGEARCPRAASSRSPRPSRRSRPSGGRRAWACPRPPGPRGRRARRSRT
jgi:hypothetical protein